MLPSITSLIGQQAQHSRADSRRSTTESVGSTASTPGMVLASAGTRVRPVLEITSSRDGGSSNSVSRTPRSSGTGEVLRVCGTHTVPVTTGSGTAAFFHGIAVSTCQCLRVVQPGCSQDMPCIGLMFRAAARLQHSQRSAPESMESTSSPSCQCGSPCARHACGLWNR